jgi:hypothetical protein
MNDKLLQILKCGHNQIKGIRGESEEYHENPQA